MTTSIDLRTPSPLRAVQLGAWTATAAMVVAIGLGLLTAEDGAVAALLDNVWARVTILDLYIALAFIGSWIAWRERSVARTLGWGLALVVTGSVAVGAYVAVSARRARTMSELLCGPQDIRPDY